MFNILLIVERPGQVIKGFTSDVGVKTLEEAQESFSAIEQALQKRAINYLWVFSHEYGRVWQTLLNDIVLDQSTTKMAIIECGEIVTKIPANI